MVACDDFFADYPWPERFRCCDQKYSKEYDYTEDELSELTGQLVHNCHKHRFTDKNDLYFLCNRVGSINVDLGKVYDVLREEQHRINAWSDEELTSAGLKRLSDEDVAKKVWRFSQEISEWCDILEQIFADAVDYAPAINKGGADVLALLKRGGILMLGSPRIRRALEAIAVAESVQSECSRSDRYRAVIEEEQPERLTPVGATLKQAERAVSRTLRERSFYGHCQGRPRKVSRQQVRSEFRATRAILLPLHRKLQKLHSSPARRRLLGASKALHARLEKAGVLEGLVAKACPPLETMVTELLAAELGVSPNTVRRYGRSKPYEQSRVGVSSPVKK